MFSYKIGLLLDLLTSRALRARSAIVHRATLRKSSLLPNAFKEMFLMTNQVHSYNTRNSNTFYLFLARTFQSLVQLLLVQTFL